LFDNSIIKKTNQWWKLMLAFGLMVAGGLLVGWLANVPDLGEVQSGFQLLLLGFLFTGAGLVFPCVAIRCPNCGARWFWQGISGKGANQWLAWLLGRSVCPTCEYDTKTNPNA
jgi:hypothetical protein